MFIAPTAESRSTVLGWIVEAQNRKLPGSYMVGKSQHVTPILDELAVEFRGEKLNLSGAVDHVLYERHVHVILSTAMSTWIFRLAFMLNRALPYGGQVLGPTLNNNNNNNKINNNNNNNLILDLTKY